MKPPENSVLVLGQTATLTVQVVSTPKAQVTWFFKGQPIKPSATKHPVEAKKDGIYTLSVLRGDANDDGVYTVVAENPAGKVQAEAKVTVCTKPKVEKIPDTAVNIGEPVRLQCQYSGQPTPSITWFKDGKSIPLDDSRVVVTQETPTLSVLTINASTMDDKGVYTAKVTNMAGDAEGKANVNVKRNE